MTQLSEYEPSSWSTDQPSSEEGVTAASLFRHHPWLIALSVLVTTVVGVLCYLNSPPRYETIAEVWVREQSSQVLTNDFGRTESRNSVQNHMYALSSAIIIERALQDLGSARPSSQSIDSVRESLSVTIAEEGSDAIQIEYVAKTPQECHDIVTSIIAAYKSFLGETTEIVGVETTKLIEKAQTDLMARLERKEKLYRQFKDETPLVWKGENTVNTHHERQVKLEEKRAALAIEDAEIRSKLVSMNETLARTGGKDIVYFQIIDSSGKFAIRPLGMQNQFSGLESALRDLRSEEMRLEESFGSGHPELVMIRKQIRTLVNELKSAEAINGEPDPKRSKSDVILAYAGALESRLRAIEIESETLRELFESEQELARATESFIAQEDILRSDLNRTKDLFDAVVARLDEINIVRDHNTAKLSVMSQPLLGTPVRPDAIKYLVVPVALGALAGFGIAFLVEVSERRFRSLDEVRMVLKSPVVGMIPQLDVGSLTSEADSLLTPVLVAAHRRSSNAAEAFRAIRTALLFNADDTQHRVVQVTSPLPGDGKSTIAANLAITLARSDKRVLLVDADFRRPAQHKLFGRPKKSTYGLGEIVRGEAELIESDVATEIDNLFVLTCGARPENPSELLTDPRFEGALAGFRERFDFVLIDTPPLLAVTDPAAVAARVDGVLLVMRMRRGCRVSVERAAEILTELGAPLIGSIINAADKKSSFYGSGYYGNPYRYGYRYQYSAEDYQPASKGQTEPLKLRSVK